MGLFHDGLTMLFTTNFWYGLRFVTGKSQCQSKSNSFCHRFNIVFIFNARGEETEPTKFGLNCSIELVRCINKNKFTTLNLKSFENIS